MKTSSMCIGLIAGMGAGAWLYSYMQKHPMKVEQAKNKMISAMKDLT